ncbi:hypothetical protein FRC08_015759 [Ceratobasidium sp. 394]|nr:hypothetical protein FRC08_015759 [Ceratobasidium sp. 394]KAG9097880.1 hypothetical protein FS749_005204 [Ceratobasidium sp. UAMH 11750]
MEPLASTASTTHTATHTPTEAVVVAANPPAHPAVCIHPHPHPCCTPTPLDLAPPTKPISLTHTPSSALAKPALLASEPTPSTTEPAPAVPPQLATHPFANNTPGHTAGQPFSGLVAATSCSSVVLSWVGSIFIDLGVPNSDKDELHKAPTKPES